MSGAIPDDVWLEVARRMSGQWTVGRGHLLTEDVLRFETVVALERAGVAPERMRKEMPARELKGGKVDLVVDPPDGTLIEFKYPRDSATGFSPDTMTFGELLRDFVRVAVVPARERWVVQVVNARLLRYLAGAGSRYGIEWSTTPGANIVLSPEALTALPATALSALGDVIATEPVRAVCVARHSIVPNELALYAFRVDVALMQKATDPDTTEVPSHPDPHVAGTSNRPPGSRARLEILASIGRVVAEREDKTFTISEIVEDMTAHGTSYARQTIQTMISSHMNAESQGPGVDKHRDVLRVERGRYRLSDGR